MRHPRWTLDGRTTEGTYRVSDVSKHWSIARFESEADAKLASFAPEMRDLLIEIGSMLQGGNSITPTRDPVVLAKIKDLLKRGLK